MTVPVFEEYEPAADCGCPGCAQQRRALAAGGHPAAQGCRRALVLFTAAGVVLGGGGAGVAHAAGLADHARPDGISGPDAARATADDDPGNEQGGREPLHGRPLAGPSGKPNKPGAALRRTTRTEIINRAKKWLEAKVPYSMDAYWTDGYRQDCSGFVSMAWNLAGNEWTGTLAQYGTPIAREALQPGDMLLFHNPLDPAGGSHVTLFGGWTDHTHTSYVAYEQTKPGTRKQATPMAYWTNSDFYIPYRYNGLSATPATASGPRAIEPFPGRAAFGPGADNKYVTRLGELLVARGGQRFYSQKPGPRWGEADRRATEAFQRAQGWRGDDADGQPGPSTWRLLVTGQGKNIAGAGAAGPGAVVPKYPGRGPFRPGQSSAYVTQLGKQLVKRGFGKHYTSGPGPRWSEADRRNVEAFQRAQGRRGAEADGYPDPETWHKLFARAT